MTSRPRAIVYIDGFNLYYALRRTPYKWLDIASLADRIAPLCDVGKVRYFTARVKPLDDPQQPQRQQAYLRALAANPRIEIEYGSFLVNSHVLPLSTDSTGAPQFGKKGRPGSRVPVLKSEEKGSDVNLAARLLIDAYEGAFDEAVVVSNDTDLITPIGHVDKNLSLPVWVSSAVARPSPRLVNASSGFRPLAQTDFAACQLADPARDARGSIYKPPKWSSPPYF